MTLIRNNGSVGEKDFAEKMGLVSNAQAVPNHWKGDMLSVPDFVLLDHDGNRCLIEYKHGNKLNTDGARGGQEAADKKKEDYINNSFGRGSIAQRRAYAASHLGWNHSVYKMIGLAQIYDRVVVVNPKLNQHSTDTTYQRNVINKGKANGVEFMNVSEFENAFEDCVDVSVDRVVSMLPETTSPASEREEN